MKAITVSALVFAVLMGLIAVWALRSPTVPSAPDPEEADVEATRPSSPSTPQPDPETSIRDRINSSISAATNRVRRARREARAMASDWQARMDRLVTSLDTLRATLPDDAGVEISVSPQGDFVDIKMLGTTDRTVRLAPSDVGEGYEAAPVGNSTAEGGEFSSVLRLLLWLKGLIGEHIADLRAANMPDDLSSPEPRLDGGG